MKFPPPVRITAPLLALVCGLAATLLDYRLNLHLDLARHLEEVRAGANTNGRRLAQLAERLLAAGQRSALQADVEATGTLPHLKLAAVIDGRGRIVAASASALLEQTALRTSLAKAAALINTNDQPDVRYGEDETTVLSAHPFPAGGGRAGWVLLDFDRAGAVAAARADALSELAWMAAAMGFMVVMLWAVLYFGFAARLMRLAQSVRAFGEGRAAAPAVLRGGDEVADLSVAFSAMSASLGEREAEKARLEREVLEISERERRRIGHDLHDGLGQRLTAASMTANALVAAMQTEAPSLLQRAEEIGRQLRGAIAEARALSHGLAPVALSDDGLMSALSSLAESAAGSGVRCVFDCPAPVRVPDAEVAGQLYRIAQEAVNNALKHAAASEIRIGLEQREGSVVLEVDDDGEGMPDTAPVSGGIGLRVMRYRAQLLGGALEIGSPPAGGTRIACRVPLSA